MLCKYNNIFGVPGEGFHKDRLFGLATNDVLGTLGIILLSSYSLGYNIILVSIIVIITTIVIHRLFCVNTALNLKIFGSVSNKK
jgi:hypothetical protein